MKSFKKFLKEGMIQENFLDRIRIISYGKEHQAEIFINPTAKELRDIGYPVRFIIDIKNKTIFAWNGYAIVHEEVIKNIQNNHTMLIGLSKDQSKQSLINSLHNYIQGNIDEDGDCRSDIFSMMTSNYTWKTKFSDREKETLQLIFNMYETESNSFHWLDKYPMFNSKKIVDMILSYKRMFEEEVL